MTKKNMSTPSTQLIKKTVKNKKTNSFNRLQLNWNVVIGDDLFEVQIKNFPSRNCKCDQE